MASARPMRAAQSAGSASVGSGGSTHAGQTETLTSWRSHCPPRYQERGACAAWRGKRNRHSQAGGPRRGKVLRAALDAEQTKVERDKAARRGLLFVLAKQRFQSGRPVGEKTMARLATRGTVGAPGDDDPANAMAAYVQRKRASLVGGASANPRYYF